MPYQKDEIKVLAQKFFGLIMGLRDGVSAADMQAMIETMMAAPAVVNEFKDDPDAATIHLIAEILDLFGDYRMNAAPADPA